MSLTVGDTIPTFSLVADDGAPVTSASLLGQGPFVIYFYPKDDTPGCTAQACSFRDAFEDFGDAGAKVYGVSADSPERHRAFKTKHRLTFTLLTDPDRAVGEQFGVKKRLGMLPGRVTFVCDAKGVVRHRFTSDFNMTKHVTESLAVVKSLRA
ncbi:MAG: peroxiredoxin Q/BCP [Bradymonadia bacterium]|jgi:peroxiredoxin Q/BCP